MEQNQNQPPVNPNQTFREQLISWSKDARERNPKYRKAFIKSRIEKRRKAQERQTGVKK